MAPAEEGIKPWWGAMFRMTAVQGFTGAEHRAPLGLAGSSGGREL
jgi:hypothetical protein